MATATAGDPLREFWGFYRRYTQTAIHTAATAALAIFGILVFVDPWFAALAIASYVVPPVALYALADESERAGREVDATESVPADGWSDEPATAPWSVDEETVRARSSAGDGDTDSDTDDGDTDSDPVGTDTDPIGTDTDTDSDDGDTDSDRRGTDTDSDRQGTDTDSDRSN